MYWILLLVLLHEALWSRYAMIQSYPAHHRVSWEHSCMRPYCDMSLWDTEPSKTPLHDTGKFMAVTTSPFMFFSKVSCEGKADYR